jgi:hypothetical protein
VSSTAIAPGPVSPVTIAAGAHSPFAHAAPRQSWPHAPQFFASAPRGVSQPFASRASQSPSPTWQAITHAPSSHALTAPALLHTCPQAPQFCESVAVCVQPPPGSPAHIV